MKKSIEFRTPFSLKSFKINSLFTAFSLCLIISLCSCSSSGSASETEIEAQNVELEEALSAHNLTAASAVADSMALFVDDLNPAQTIQVLTAFITIHNDAAATGDKQRDLETMRKFVDVYDLSMAIHGKDMRKAVERAKGKGVDIESYFDQFRENLVDYDDSQATDDYDNSDVRPDSTAVKRDSIAAPANAAADHSADDIPLEHRPAE